MPSPRRCRAPAGRRRNAGRGPGAGCRAARPGPGRRRGRAGWCPPPEGCSTWRSAARRSPSRSWRCLARCQSMARLEATTAAHADVTRRLASARRPLQQAQADLLHPVRQIRLRHAAQREHRPHPAFLGRVQRIVEYAVPLAAAGLPAQHSHPLPQPRFPYDADGARKRSPGRRRLAARHTSHRRVGREGDGQGRNSTACGAGPGGGEFLQLSRGFQRRTAPAVRAAASQGAGIPRKELDRWAGLRPMMEKSRPSKARVKTRAQTEKESP